MSAPAQCVPSGPLAQAWPHAGSGLVKLPRRGRPGIELLAEPAASGALVTMARRRSSLSVATSGPRCH